MLPEGWRIKTLGETGKCSGGGTPSKKIQEYWDNGSIPWVSPKDMITSRISKSVDYITPQAVRNSATKIYPANSILIVTRSGILRKKMPVAVAMVSVAVNQDIKVIQPNEDVYTEYLANYLWNYNSTILGKCAKDGTTVESIDTTSLLSFPIRIPPLPEQQKIAQILSTWDKAITTVEQLLSNSQQCKKALMQQLLTGKKRLRDDNGERFCGEWTIGRLGDLCTFKGGSAFKEKYQGKTQGNFPFIKVSDMNTRGNERYINFSNNWLSKEELKQIKAKTFPVDSIVFAKVGAALLLNRRRILSQPTIIDNNMMAAIPKENTQTEFLYQLMLLIDFAKFVQDGAVPSINQSDLSTFKICYPTSTEQQKIATVLSTADREIEALQNKLDCLKQEKKALMQQLLTGKRRVNIDQQEVN